MYLYVVGSSFAKIDTFTVGTDFMEVSSKELVIVALGYWGIGNQKVYPLYAFMSPPGG